MKNLLKKSGIKYCLIPSFNGKYEKLQGKEIVDEVNPFAVLAKNGSMIDRMVDSEILERFDDTYEIIAGNHFDMDINEETRKGLLDILVVPLISRILCYHAAQSENSTAVRLLSGVIGVPLEFLRFVAAIGLTLAVSPLLIIVHLLIAGVGKERFRQKMNAVNEKLSDFKESVFGKGADEKCSLVNEKTVTP